ncbi:hypothetical protein NVS55_37205 [Myxococcus stipitatus]|uniref:hypothetical protein n=1 Tax=Myxococcus stipitatus TaxID=83455 RepID=UPI0031450FD9
MSRTWSLVAALWLVACGTQEVDSPDAARSTPQEWEGELEVRVVDSPAMDSSYEEYVLVSGRERRPVVFQGKAPEGLRSGLAVKLRGEAREHTLLAQAVEVRPGAKSASTVTGACGVTGVQRSLVIMAAFPGMPVPAVTKQAVEAAFFSTTGTSLAGYWSEVSEGRATTTGTVVDWTPLDRAYSCQESDALREAAIRAVDASVDFTRFDRVFIVHPRPQAGCHYGGLGTLSCGQVSTQDGVVSASTSWLIAESFLNHTNAVKLIAHEAGHNLSFGHAQTRDHGAETLTYLNTPGNMDEYGDGFSAMGLSNLGHYAAPQKARIGWLAPAAVTSVDGVGGTFTVAPVTAASGVKALKVRRGQGNAAWLWLEYRRRVGSYESTLPFLGGALVHYEDGFTAEGSHLLDFTPGTPSWTDPALLPGTTWNDPYSNLSVTVVSASASGLTVTIAYRQAACVRAAPEVEVRPLEPTVWPGGRPEVELVIRNRDSVGCAPSTFQLAPIIPTGWGSDPVAATRTVNAASTASEWLQLYVPYSMALGSYAPGVDVTRDGHTVRGTAPIQVVERCTPSPPTLTLTPATVTAAPGTDVTWTVHVANNDSASCNWVWYDFYSDGPAGWDTQWSDWGVNLPPGGDFTFTLTKSIPATAEGTHAVEVMLFQEDVGQVATTSATVHVQ